MNKHVQGFENKTLFIRNFILYKNEAELKQKTYTNVLFRWQVTVIKTIYYHRLKAQLVSPLYTMCRF